MTEDVLTAKEIREFSGYLRQCTDRQVQGVYDKEKAADREAYMALAIIEAERRGIELDLGSEPDELDDDTQVD